jgi:hypothetical protein
MHACIHTCIHIHMHACIHTHTYACIPMHTYIQNRKCSRDMFCAKDMRIRLDPASLAHCSILGSLQHPWLIAASLAHCSLVFACTEICSRVCSLNGAVQQRSAASSSPMCAMRLWSGIHACVIFSLVILKIISQALCRPWHQTRLWCINSRSPARSCTMTSCKQSG